MDSLSTKKIFDSKIDKIICHIENSIYMAKNNKSKLNNDILNIEGYSGIKTRHLYNNICDIDNINYLEVGTYLGSTLISSSYNNNISSTGIDNWSEFGGPKEKCLKNIKQYMSNNSYVLIEKDCFEITNKDLKNPIDIYLYDGNHEYDSQIKAITYFEKFLNEISIILIDDFRDDGNWKAVTEGTFEGFNQSNLEILYQNIIKSQQEKNGKENFWNGCGIFLCKKRGSHV